MTEQFITTGR